MRKKYHYLIIISLIVASGLAFSPIAGNDFINFDDGQYITENNHIQSGINVNHIKWAFSDIVGCNWHPLTLLSHMLDWTLFGANAHAHHLVSLLLHIGAVIFLFLFLNKTTHNVWSSAFVAFFFAVHPLRVESVAWASERKDVLSMFFGMATLYSYAFYAESSKTAKYSLCLMLFILALMSKPMMVTLPFVLMLLDYWPLQRWQKAMKQESNSDHSLKALFVEKIPFICLAIIVSLITFWIQNREGAVSLKDALPFFTRAANAIVSYAAYLQNIFWPVNLSVFYPYNFSPNIKAIIFSGMIIIVITFAVFYYVRKLPLLMVGWFWYLGTLVPVIGLVQIGGQSMADRYTYLPSIGISIMLAWAIPHMMKRRKIRKIILGPACLSLLIIMSILTWKQCLYWKDSATLFSHALQVTKNNYLAHNNFGLALNAQGKTKEALEHYSESIRIKPDYIFAYINRGSIYNNFGRYQSAINDYNQVIFHQPNYAIAYYNRGLAYFNLGQYKSAISDYNKTIRLQPDNAAAYNNRGNTYLRLGNTIRGCMDAKKACSMGVCYALELAGSTGICH